MAFIDYGKVVDYLETTAALDSLKKNGELRRVITFCKKEKFPTKLWQCLVSGELVEHCALGITNRCDSINDSQSYDKGSDARSGSPAHLEQV